MTTYFIVVIFLIVAIFYSLVVLDRHEKKKELRKCKVFATQYGKLYIKKDGAGVEAKNEKGQRKFIPIRMNEVNESIAQSIIMTQF